VCEEGDLKIEQVVTYHLVNEGPDENAVIRGKPYSSWVIQTLQQFIRSFLYFFVLRFHLLSI
jgi:hypothetical protein